MALMYAEVTVEGTKSLFFHVFTKEKRSLERSGMTNLVKNDPEEWRHTYTADDKGQLYVYSSYVLGCLREAAKYTNGEEGSIQSKFYESLQIVSNRAYFNRYVPEEVTTDETKPVYIDSRSVRKAPKRASEVRYRLALAPGWQTSFEIVWNSELVTTEQVEGIVNDAGLLVGIADGRAIGYGRFKVMEFKAMSYEKYKGTLEEKTNDKNRTA